MRSARAPRVALLFLGLLMLLDGQLSAYGVKMGILREAWPPMAYVAARWGWDAVIGVKMVSWMAISAIILFVRSQWAALADWAIAVGLIVQGTVTIWAALLLALAWSMTVT